MAKKDGEKQIVPVVTSLPLPSSDSVLVIDLPDGQKLLVGKMAPGSVIEVATWRGTGRPDSRTNRLMLGMSNGENVEAAQDVQQEQVNKLSFAYVLYIIRNIPPYLVLVFNKIRDRITAMKKGKTDKAEPADSDIDVQEWLNKITNRVNAFDSELSESPDNQPNSIKTARKSPQKRKSSAKKPRK